MPETTAHPSQEQLSAYNFGQLPPDEAVAIETHISKCEPCCDTILSLSADDTFVGLLKEARQLPTDQTVDHGLAPVSWSDDGVPAQLAEHPRYEILSLIGKGGMGDVYKARHRKMERTVALKVINRGLVRKAEAVDRFHREVKAAAQLSHPNIVTAHDADQAGDYHFMVMEFVDGVDLSQIVKDRGALPVADACDAIRQAAIGLQHAHECGMVHRDIKPHNLMVTADGIIKILDFGLASLAPEAIPASDAVAARSDLTAAGAIMGTPDFISPEQANDARQVDIRSDIYSLGTTLYYLLSGRVPFDDGSVMHKLRSHAQVEPAPLNSVRDDVPGELVTIVSKMMAKDPDERYLTPKEVADALESFLRTWKPGEANSQGQLVLGGGNNFESGGQKSVAGDAGRDWLLVIARALFAISLVPVALLCYETWAFDRANPDVGVGYRTWAYMLVTLCLSTIAGIASAVHRLNTGRSQSNRGDRRVFGMTAIEALAAAAVLIAGCLAAGLYYTNGNIGGIRVEVTAPEDIGNLGTHPLTIVDTSGKKPLGGTTSTHQDDASGITTHSFKSANGRYNISLVDEFLTVNGERYTLENPTDAIRIVDDRVEITQVTALRSKPELKITGKTVNKGKSGLPSVYDWSFKGRDVGDLKVRLLLAQNGKTEVIQEFDYEELPAEFANKVRLQVKDAARSPKGRRVSAILYVESPVPSSSTSINEDKGLSIDVEAPFSNKMEPADLEPIEPGQTELLLALSYWKGDMTHDLSMESMTAATNGGNATFLFVTLDWSPASPDVRAATANPDTSPNAKHVSECETIQVALRKHFMDKHPLFAASVNQRTKILSDLRKLGDMETRRQISELAINSPVSEVINSFPGKPYVTFTEVTRASGDNVNVVSVNLYRNADGTCLIEVTQKERKKLAGETIANVKPITEEEVRKLVRRVAKDSDFAQLQAEWESVSVTEGGKQLSAKEGIGSLLLRIEGSTFSVTETKPNGAKSKVDTGRIEIDNTTTPKTIDFIGREQSSFGIYEFNEGLLRVCLVEQGGTDAPFAERTPEAITLKRPTKFESPVGSNLILMEFAADQPVLPKDLSAVQGIWQVTYSEDGGRIAPQEMLKEIRFVIDEQNLITEIGGRKSVSAYKLDPSTSPQSIDLTENGRTKRGIYDLEGDTLRICIAESGDQRPTAFDSQPNSANDIVLILKRVKPGKASSVDTDGGANTLSEPELSSNDTPTRAAQERGTHAAPRQASQQRSDNHLQMPLCWCPAGEFKMDRKQLPVTLTRGFWMGKHEVTQAQYGALMSDNPSENKGESLPVEKVAWNEAKKFCQKFTELERKAGRLPKGWEYRLPTEAQWEYACRAGTNLIWDDEKALVYPSTFGEDLSELGDYAWYSENSDGTPHPVGQKKPNAWELCDMYGNVREWVRDAWQSKLSGGKDPEVDVWSPIHTRRGGDWLTSAEPCGSPFNRGIGVAGREAHMMGFRVALVPVGDSGDGAAAGGDLNSRIFG